MADGAHVYLDLGVNLGYAIRHADGRLEHGGEHFKLARHEQDGARFRAFRGWLHDLKRRIEATGQQIVEICFELVDFMPAERTGPYAQHAWGAFWGVLTGWAEHHGIPYRGIAVGTIKKGLTGRGDAPKTERAKAARNARVLAKAKPGKAPRLYDGPTIESALRARGYAITDHNEADAVAMALGGA